MFKNREGNQMNLDISDKKERERNPRFTLVADGHLISQEKNQI